MSEWSLLTKEDTDDQISKSDSQVLNYWRAEVVLFTQAFDVESSYLFKL